MDASNAIDDIECNRKSMKQLNIFACYSWGRCINPLKTIKEGTKIADIWFQLLAGRHYADEIASGTLLSLRTSVIPAMKLVDAIDAIFPNKTANVEMDRTLTWNEAYNVRSSAEELETILSAELATCDTYCVSQKGIYNTSDLIERASLALGTKIQYLPEDIKHDFDAAGRCLAFELPTACGFHTMRAVESVLRTYHRLVKRLPDGQKSPDMAVCINELRSNKEDPKLMDILDHLRDLHRNTTMHPEAFLTMEEALRLFDISKSAINGMSDRIRDLSFDYVEKTLKREALEEKPQLSLDGATPD